MKNEFLTYANKIENYRTFKILTVGQGYNTAAKIKIIDTKHLSNQKPKQVKMSYPVDDTTSTAWVIAAKYLEGLGFEIVARSHNEDMDLLMVADYERDLK